MSFWPTKKFTREELLANTQEGAAALQAWLAGLEMGRIVRLIYGLKKIQSSPSWWRDLNSEGRKEVCALISAYRAEYAALALKRKSALTKRSHKKEKVAA